MPDDRTEGIGKSADAKDCDGQDAEKGHDLLPSPALALLAADAAHGGIGEVRRQGRLLAGRESLAQDIIIYWLFHVS